MQSKTVEPVHPNDPKFQAAEHDVSKLPSLMFPELFVNKEMELVPTEKPELAVPLPHPEVEVLGRRSLLYRRCHVAPPSRFGWPRR